MYFLVMNGDEHLRENSAFFKWEKMGKRSTWITKLHYHLGTVYNSIYSFRLYSEHDLPLLLNLDIDRWFFETCPWFDFPWNQYMFFIIFL